MAGSRQNIVRGMADLGMVTRWVADPSTRVEPTYGFRRTSAKRPFTVDPASAPD
jgi:hypothetical protein